MNAKHNNPRFGKKFKLKKGDEVVITTGRSKGQSGAIERVDRKRDRVYVKGANLYVKHTKPSMQNEAGGILEKAMPVHISNVAFVDPSTKKPTRIGFKIEDGKKVRFCKSSGTII